MTWLSTRRNASVGKSPLSGMPPANEITAGFDVAALTSVRARSSSAAMICALRERSAGQSRGAGASGAGAARSPSTEGSPPEVRRGSEAPGAPGLSVTNVPWPTWARAQPAATSSSYRSEEHTSELQSQSNLVCRLLLEKKTEVAYSLG